MYVENMNIIFYALCLENSVSKKEGISTLIEKIR